MTRQKAVLLGKEKAGQWKIKELTENCQPIFLPIGTQSKGFGKPKATPVSGMEKANLEDTLNHVNKII